MKWHEKVLIVLLVIVFSPLILISLIIVSIAYLIHLPGNIKEYKNSQYYTDFKLPFMHSRLYSPEYRFYNSYKDRDLQIKYIRQESNGLEYFMYNGILFLFPDFDNIDFDEEKQVWQVDYDGEWKDYEDSYIEILAKLDADAPDLPIKVLVERKMFIMTDLNGVAIPESVFITWNYERAFENEDSPLKLRVPTTTQELYEMMLETPALCGDYEIKDNGNIHWNLHKGIKIEIGVDEHDCYFGVSKELLGKVESGITHWHPTVYEIYEEICKIGKRGHVLVLCSFGTGGGVLYMGEEKNCPYSPYDKRLFGKLYYLKVD